ncbi:flagellar motor protein MotB [Flavobacterium magnum]|uniref:Flagellar motor protein MotB n=1 Tax=Flavobacterium magnum TaxID=2162713 RepID=A0A2S0RAQ6_9FLAO|nr:OmpA family protein [Flavobacterium magnum]AWA28615.1 flagellar motor protein MotB [Flavobacterium magnum]
MKKSILFILLLVNFGAVNMYSQKTSLKKAEKKYDNYAYVDAIKIYETIAKKGYKDEKMFQRLGNAYYFNSEFEKAEGAYRELFTMNPEQKEEYYYRYAQSLKSVGKYTEAEQMMVKFNEKSGNDKRAMLFKDNRNYLEVIKLNSKRFYIEDAGINSEYSDYGSSMVGNKLVFATTRDTGGVVKRRHKWNNKAFSNLYDSEVQQDFDAVLGKPSKFSKEVNTKFHESTPVFTKDGKTMYFTRNNFNRGRQGENRFDIILLKIYKATLEGDKWTNVVELPFDNDEYSCAHPALSADERTLYFASDMPGSFGESDLYKVAINEDGSFGTPVNLGASINTPGKESFPYVTDEDELYFASDGHPGLGGLDIFVAKIRKDGVFRNIQNLGQPLNSRKDDFAYLLDTKTRTGYFTSNREGGKGFDDIYKFTELRKLNCEQILEGVVTDSETNQPIADAQVVLYDSEMEKITTVNTDSEGKYSFGPVDCDSKYYIRADKTDYETNETPFLAPKQNGNTYLPLTLKKRIVKIEPGVDLAERGVLDIPTIYFNLDKWNIRKDAAFELEKVLAVMNQYPTMKIDVRSHTDSRATYKYNMALSEKRAKSTIEWLVRNGIDASRLTGRGYGETQLVNKCADGVKCTEAEHQMNRRSQFIVVEF